jgi:CheY-like chemotaxis protein
MLGLCGTKKKTRQSRILVVDNNPDSGSCIQQLLQSCDGDVVCTTHEKKAVEEAIQARPTLILLDPMTQSAHNYDTLKFIKQNPTLRDIPVVMCTGSSTNSRVSDDNSSGHALMIVKANTKTCHVISHRLLNTLLHLVEQQDCILL